MRQIAALAATQGDRCGICHMPLTAHDMDFDHIVPVALGGTDTERNLRLVHAGCNRSRGARI